MFYAELGKITEIGGSSGVEPVFSRGGYCYQIRTHQLDGSSSTFHAWSLRTDLSIESFFDYFLTNMASDLWPVSVLVEDSTAHIYFIQSFGIYSGGKESDSQHQSHDSDDGEKATPIIWSFTTLNRQPHLTLIESTDHSDIVWRRDSSIIIQHKSTRGAGAIIGDLRFPSSPLSFGLISSHSTVLIPGAVGWIFPNDKDPLSRGWSLIEFTGLDTSQVNIIPSPGFCASKCTPGDTTACSNAGVCNSQGTGCECLSSRSGSICQSDCRGVCSDRGTSCDPVIEGTPVCVCDPGYTGPVSSLDLFETYSSEITFDGRIIAEDCTIECEAPCNGHGSVCDSTLTGICVCDPGYYGSDCSNSCSDLCSNHGSCRISPTGYVLETCSCDAGWTGESCNINCRESVCSGHGSCFAGNSARKPPCVCDFGWSGRYCEKAVDISELSI